MKVQLIALAALLVAGTASAQDAKFDLLRISKPIQNATYPNMNPSWSTRYPYGSIYDPVVRH